MISSLETILTHFLSHVASELSWRTEESEKEETAVALNSAFLIAYPVQPALRPLRLAFTWAKWPTMPIGALRPSFTGEV
jgi:hypothetical protein